MPGNLPIKKFKSANIEVAIWSNKKDVDGTEVEFKTISLSRSYKKSRDDVWRNDVVHLRRGDITKVLVVLNEAQKYLFLTEEKEGGEESEEG